MNHCPIVSISRDDLVKLLQDGNYPSKEDLEKVPFGKLLIDTGRSDSFFVEHMKYMIQSTDDVLNLPNPADILIDARALNDDHQEFQRSMAKIRGYIRQRDSNSDLLMIAALYHDIGKSIRRERHPYEGWHILKDLYPNETHDLESILGKDSLEYLIKLVKYHEIFGTVSTGESSMPIFINLMPFMKHTSCDEIRQLFSMLLLMNMADMNASLKGGSTSSGINFKQAMSLINDWNTLDREIDSSKGARTAFMKQLIENEATFERAAKRLKRLLRETSPNLDIAKIYTLEMIEELITHNFRTEGSIFTFCNFYARFYRMDYLKRFLTQFQKAAIDKDLSPFDVGSIVIEIIDNVVNEYRGSIKDMDLIGVEFSTLGGKISEEIINLLIQKKNKEALNWILDEISVFKLKI